VKEEKRLPHRQVEANCKQCGATFRHPILRPRLFCSRDCYSASRPAFGTSPGKVEIQCQSCGGTFRNYLSQKRRFCSTACVARAKRDPSKYATATCAGCQSSFTYLIAQIGERKFCSRRCSGIANVGNIKHWKPSRRSANCEKCGNEFEFTPGIHRGRFCSLACFGVLKRRKKDPVLIPTPEPIVPAPKTRKNAKRPIELFCVICGVRFTSNARQCTRMTCSDLCYRALQGQVCGDLHPRWRGGHSEYYGPSWRPAQRAVRLRDVVCQDCGITPEQLGKKLDVHHKIPFIEFGVERHEEANALDNLVALCISCHQIRDWAYRRDQQPRVFTIPR